MKVCFYLVLVVSFIQSCAVHQKSLQMQDGMKIYTLENVKWIKSQGFDSETGSIQVGKQIFHYEYGMVPDIGPQTVHEYFEKSFRGNYYYHFFEYIHIEEKLARGYIDSVQISDIKPSGQFVEKKLKECSTCNYEAKLTFRGRSYVYPFYFTNSEISDYLIYVDTIGDYKRKIYKSKVMPGKLGLVLQPIFNKKDTNILSVIQINSMGEQQSESFLRGISIKEL